MEKFFFVNDYNYKINDTIEIVGEEHSHLAYVVRCKIGEKIVCLPNDGRLLFCTIKEIQKNKTILSLDDIEYGLNDASKKVTCFIGMPKSDKFEFLIQKLSELGVDTIIPFVSKFVDKIPGNDKCERYNKIAREACKQCRRSKIINVGKLLTFEQMLLEIKKYDKALFCYEKSGGSTISENVNTSLENVAYIVGCEGGFSDDEAERIVEAGAIKITVGKRILRAETAGVVCGALVMEYLDELK